MTSSPLVVALSTDDACLVVDLSGSALPSVVHWGEPLTGLDAGGLAALSDTGAGLGGANDIDAGRRVAVLPEHSRAWTGRPGLEGSRDGRAWSTRFTVREATLDGIPITDSVVSGPGLIVVEAVDAHAGLGLRLELGLDPSGLVRARATVTNLVADPFTVDGARARAAAAGRARRAARLRWPVGSRTVPAAAAAAHRHPPA